MDRKNNLMSFFSYHYLILEDSLELFSQGNNGTISELSLNGTKKVRIERNQIQTINLSLKKGWNIGLNILKDLRYQCCLIRIPQIISVLNVFFNSNFCSINYGQEVHHTEI